MIWFIIGINRKHLLFTDMAVIRCFGEGMYKNMNMFCVRLLQKLNKFKPNFIEMYKIYAYKKEI